CSPTPAAARCCSTRSARCRRRCRRSCSTCSSRPRCARSARRRSGPYIAVNCAALPDQLLESELFGHTKGSFTGAVSDREGLFADASGGTLLLDEIGEMSPALQAKLLHVLESATVRPVGATKERSVDVRVIAATHRDLRAKIREGTFREDLMYRLDVVSIELPPLRHRREDIPLLVEHFLADSRARHPQSPVIGFHRDALAVLLDHAWPGNVRELAHVIERCVLLGNAAEVTVADLPAQLREPPAAAQQSFEGAVLPVRELQRRYARWALDKLGGHKARTAAELGVDTKTLNRWLAGDLDDD
ncbi:MAG TPA: sigma-54 dependent transcriptional regulator, partial [Kofleriaceae bacterium]|nr:sigma-54 dependent transcriptional regulator [Kofleriaceae bacterium]